MTQVSATSNVYFARIMWDFCSLFFCFELWWYFMVEGKYVTHNKENILAKPLTFLFTSSSLSFHRFQFHLNDYLRFSHPLLANKLKCYHIAHNKKNGKFHINNGKFKEFTVGCMQIYLICQHFFTIFREIASR